MRDKYFESSMLSTERFANKRRKIMETFTYQGIEKLFWFIQAVLVYQTYTVYIYFKEAFTKSK